MARGLGHGCLVRVLGLFMTVALLLGGYMTLEARVVRLESCEVFLRDLPEAFEGVKVLLVTDPHIGTFCSGTEMAGLVSSMQSLAPDILLLGGDYAGVDPFGGTDAETALSRRDEFFAALGWFYAPLGKFGVRGNHDAADGLAEAMAAGGVTLLSNQVARLEKDGARLYLAGLDDFTTGAQDIASLAGMVREQDAVLALSHNPDAFPAALREGKWFDLMLAGHTHGGQINIPGLNKLSTPSIYGARYLSGWTREEGALLLVSNGVGTTFLPLRLNAPPQVHLLTLRRG